MKHSILSVAAAAALAIGLGACHDDCQIKNCLLYTSPSPRDS